MIIDHQTYCWIVLLHMENFDCSFKHKTESRKINTPRALFEFFHFDICYFCFARNTWKIQPNFTQIRICHTHEILNSKPLITHPYIFSKSHLYPNGMKISICCFLLSKFKFTEYWTTHFYYTCHWKRKSMKWKSYSVFFHCVHREFNIFSD